MNECNSVWQVNMKYREDGDGTLPQSQISTPACHVPVPLIPIDSKYG